MDSWRKLCQVRNLSFHRLLDLMNTEEKNKGCSSLITQTSARFLTIPGSYKKLQLHCQKQRFLSSGLKAGGALLPMFPWACVFRVNIDSNPMKCSWSSSTFKRQFLNCSSLLSIWHLFVFFKTEAFWLDLFEVWANPASKLFKEIGISFVVAVNKSVAVCCSI